MSGAADTGEQEPQCLAHGQDADDLFGFVLVEDRFSVELRVFDKIVFQQVVELNTIDRKGALVARPQEESTHIGVE